MDAKSSVAVPLSSPAAAQRCAEGAGLDSGTAAAAQSAMPSIAFLTTTVAARRLLSTKAAAPAVPQLQSRISTNLTDVTLVVGEHIGAALRRREVRQDDARHLVEAEQMRGEHPAVAGDNAVLFVDQHRVGEAKFADRGGDLRDLLVAVRARVSGVGDQRRVTPDTRGALPRYEI